MIECPDPVKMEGSRKVAFCDLEQLDRRSEMRPTSSVEFESSRNRVPHNCQVEYEGRYCSQS